MDTHSLNLATDNTGDVDMNEYMKLMKEFSEIDQA